MLVHDLCIQTSHSSQAMAWCDQLTPSAHTAQGYIGGSVMPDGSMGPGLSSMSPAIIKINDTDKPRCDLLGMSSLCSLNVLVMYPLLEMECKVVPLQVSHYLQW